MAWNEPPGKDEKDPWTGKQKPPQGPPDLEEALRQLHKKIVAALNGIQKAKGSGGSSPRAPISVSQAGLGFIGGIIFLIWFIAGIFIVDPAERAVILRFGKYIETVGPGPHWIPRFIESAYVVNEEKISNYSYDAQMLTQDENIVSVAVAVQYRIMNARDYLFNVVNARESLQQATASALRQVIGRTTLDAVLTSGRDQVRSDVMTILTQTLQRYGTGLLITDIAMQPAKAPDEVKEAFDDAIKAQEDELRFQNKAQAYAMQVEPTAKGRAQRLIADAQAYKQQVVLQAEADTSRYLALLPEYLKASNVMRARLYLDTMETVLSKTSKIVIDSNGSNNMFYLPLEKLFQKAEDAKITQVVTPAEVNTAPSPAQAPLTTTTGEAVNNNDAGIYTTSGGYQ